MMIFKYYAKDRMNIRWVLLQEQAPIRDSSPCKETTSKSQQQKHKLAISKTQRSLLWCCCSLFTEMRCISWLWMLRISIDHSLRFYVEMSPFSLVFVSCMCIFKNGCKCHENAGFLCYIAAMYTYPNVNTECIRR